MSATCDKCETRQGDRRTVYLCPLHAEAEAMRDVLARLEEAASDAVRDTEINAGGRLLRATVADLEGISAAARAILARIDAVPAERGRVDGAQSSTLERGNGSRRRGTVLGLPVCERA